MSEHLSEEQMLSIINDAEQKVTVDFEYVHKKTGNIYTVAGFVFIEKTMELFVTYYSPYSSQITFSRPVDEFLDKFE